MNYVNGREAVVGDRIVSLSNHQAGVVSRVDLPEKLQFLAFVERKNGEQYTLIPVTTKDGRHFEPVSFEVPAETCVHIEDVVPAKKKKDKGTDKGTDKGEDEEPALPANGN